MAKIESSVTVNRPIEEVFTFVTDIRNSTKWMSGVLEAAQTSSGPMGVGATYRFNIEVMGRKLETTGEVAVYDPPSKYAWKASSGPFPMSGSTTCEPVAGGTLVTDTIEVEPGGFFKLAEPLLIKQQRGQVEKDMKRLKELLEASGG